MGKKFVMAYSCGKDSTLALYKMIEKGYKPVCLLITTGDGEDSWFHGIPKVFIDKVSKSLEIPVIYQKCNMGNYEEDFVEGLKIAKNKHGARYCVFGDIDLENHKEWDLEMCRRAELEGVLPLWQEKREKVTLEFIEIGFKAVIKKVNLDNMGEEFLGQILSKDIILKIKETGSDICGENGEYHTFVFDGPIFKEKIEYKIIEKRQKDNYGHLVIKEE